MIKGKILFVLNVCLRMACLLWLYVISGVLVVNAQTLPGNVPPKILSQVRAMSPYDQQSLAREYGIELGSPSRNGGDVDPALGSKGGELVSAAPPSTETEVFPLGEAEEVVERARKRFGRQLFDSSVSTFAPTDQASIPDTYRLGVGDELVIQLLGNQTELLRLQIGRDGTVNFPKLGPISLAGITFEDAQDLLKTQIGEQFIGVKASVSMGRLRAINIFMAGEVAVPGAYSVSSFTTVTQSLYQAGGVSDIGSVRNIQVLRQGKLVSTFDVYDLLMFGKTDKDIRLRSGDVVLVPPYSAVVDVEGEVKRSMVFELVGGETIADVLSMAGHFTEDAFPERSVLTRKSSVDSLPVAVTINLASRDKLDELVVSGDHLRIPKRGDTVSKSVVVKGAVNRPGYYGWSSGMRVTDLLSDVRRDLATDVDLRIGIIVRQKNTLLDIEVLSFDLGAAIESPGSIADPVLKEFDEILIFSLVTAELSEVAGAGKPITASRQDLLGPVVSRLKSQARELQSSQIISVSGAVRAPGSYPLVQGSTIKEFIELAGGLKESAFTDSAELRSVYENPQGEISVKYKYIDLNFDQSRQSATLADRDHIHVREIPNWSQSESVVVSGEVLFPGTYQIVRGERISDLIARAGGLTSQAAPRGAVFSRKAIADLQAERGRQLANDIEQSFAARLLTEEGAPIGIMDVKDILNSLRAGEGFGRLVVDVEAALDGVTEANIELADNDSLFIPQQSKVITVVGEIHRETAHTFDSSLTIEDYIELSAGLTNRAHKAGIYVIKPNGAVMTAESSLLRFASIDMSLEAGDTIVVPIDTSYKDSLSLWREVTEVVYQGVVSIAAIAAVGR